MSRRSRPRRLHGGPHAITAVYGGDGNYNGSTGTLSGGQQVDKVPLTVTADDKSRSYGQRNPALTVRYTGFAISENSSNLSGSPACATSATATSSVGGSPYPISCSTGTLASNDYSFAFEDASLTITKATSFTLVTSDQNPSVFGQTVTLTATISGYGGGSATGNVDFIINGGAPQTPPVTGNHRDLHHRCPSRRQLSVEADYSGDGNLTTSTDTLDTNQLVNQASTTTVVALTSGTDPSTFGTSVTFTATVAPVAPGTGTPTGTVQFKDGGGDLGTPVTLASGEASYSTAALTVATHTISAVYLDDSDFVGSTSRDLQDVQKAADSTGVTSSGSASHVRRIGDLHRDRHRRRQHAHGHGDLHGRHNGTRFTESGRRCRHVHDSDPPRGAARDHRRVRGGHELQRVDRHPQRRAAGRQGPPDHHGRRPVTVLWPEQSDAHVPIHRLRARSELLQSERLAGLDRIPVER